jgi:hypothetical protein
MSKARTVIPIKAIDFDAARRTVEEFSSERNVPTHVYPKEAPPAGPAEKGRGAPSVAAVPARSPSRKFTVELPDYVIDAIQARTIQSKPKRTARYVVLEGLRAIGIQVEEADMVMDGRRIPEVR